MIAILLCFVAGADLLFMALRYLMVGRIEPEIENWNSEIRMFATSTIWVPHHILALVAGWTGLLLNARARSRETPQRLWLAVGAGAAYASMFGASVWISLTLAPVLIVWGMMALWRRDGTLLLSGVVALLLSVPQCLDLIHGRAPDVFPVALHIRPFTLLFAGHDLTAQLWSLILLPLNYALEFGFVMLGASLYARSARPTEAILGRARLKRTVPCTTTRSCSLELTSGSTPASTKQPEPPMKSHVPQTTANSSQPIVGR